MDAQSFATALERIDAELAAGQTGAVETDMALDRARSLISAVLTHLEEEDYRAEAEAEANPPALAGPGPADAADPTIALPWGALPRGCSVTLRRDA